MGHFYPEYDRGFTLIELLVVIAIIAILAVVVVLTLNPAQLLAQSRDANRVSDLATLNSAINLYATDQSGASSFSLGASSTAYLSLPSSASNCSTLGIATSAYGYACATNANYRNASSSGWIPVNLQAISAGSPLGSLPVDPVNQSSSDLYYSYETNGSVFAVGAFMESAKYAKTMSTGGGIDPALAEAGSGISVLPNASRGMVGYWPLNQGSNSTVTDYSGNSNGTLVVGASGSQTSIAQAWANGAAAGHGGAISFDGTDDYLSMPALAIPSSSAFSWSAWIYVKGPGFTGSTSYGTLFGDSSGLRFLVSTGGPAALLSQAGGGNFFSTYSIPLNQWHHVAYVFTGTLEEWFIDGALNVTNASTSDTWNHSFNVGAYSSPTNYLFNGYMNDIRFYDRALSASEIQQIYNAEK